ncbi:MAG: response regulator, partial [Alphaproteobacteria bacterium]|nr:response regulator [Alphaproteobacteria bacterium]
SITKKDFDNICHEINFHVTEEQRLKMILPLSLLYDLGVSWQELFEDACDKLQAAEARRETTGSLRVNPPEEKAKTEMSKDILGRRFDRARNAVLIVEDDPLSVFIAKKSVEPDCIAFVATDGESACESYSKHAPDVVFLDIGLPDISGHDVLTKILSIDPTAYVVMLSANSTRPDIMRAMQLGAKGFIGKPFSKSKLAQYIAQAPTYHTV